MVRLLLAAALIVLGPGATVATPAPAPTQSANRLAHDLPRLREWIDAVDRHKPGERDGAVISVASWSRSELDVLFLDLKALLQVVARPDGPKLPRAARPFTLPELQQLRDLAEREAQRVARRPGTLHELSETEARRAVNRLVKRAALLHMDIALLVRAVADQFPGSAAIGPSQLPAPRPSVLVLDGRQEGVSYSGVHWDCARLLLDQVTPDPSRNTTVGQWYRGVAVFFASRRLLNESGPHLERARQLFPADPEIFAASGRVHESYAAPRIQNFAQASRQPGGPTVAIGSARSNLRQAETHFRKAVELDGNFVEARVHLGRVVGLQGRHEDAAGELQRATATADDSLTLYFAWLFLGAEEQTLGHPDRARESFDSAAALYPRAQSPRLALSQLARQNGDRPGALRALEPVLIRPADNDDGDDPWWTYLDDPGHTAESQLAELRAALFLTREER